MALTLLVVDDHPSIRRLLELVTDEDPRFRPCLTAGTGDAALLLARDHRPDVIVLDADLGGRDGLALIPALRAAVPAVAVAVFSSTAYVSPDVAAKAGADTFLPKGTDLDELLDTLAALPAAGQPTTPPVVVDLRDSTAARGRHV